MARNTFDIEKFSNEIMQNCDTCQVKEFAKNEIITTYIVNRNMLCVLLEGSADLIRYDFDGNQMIVEKFNKYDVFGEIFYRININNELFVKAREKTKILMLNYDIFEKKCKKNCKFHETLLRLFKTANLGIYRWVLEATNCFASLAVIPPPKSYSAGTPPKKSN